MVYDEKLKKVCNDFSLLSEEKQDYILGILQALVFAKNNSENLTSVGLTTNQPESDNN